MSNRGQEATSSESSPVAKPKPMVPAKETNQLGITQPMEREKLFTEFGEAGQSGKSR